MARKSKDYKVFPKARRDLEGIWLYTVETWSLAQAEQYIRQLTDGFEALAQGTRPGQNAGAVREGYRRLSVGSHVIFYRETDTLIEIVRVLHQRRDFSRHL